MSEENKTVELKEEDLEKVSGGTGEYKWCSNCGHHYYLTSTGCCPECGKKIL